MERACLGYGGGDQNPCITSLADHGTVESLRCYLARRTLLEMLRDRGYDVPESELTRSLSDFRTVFGNKPELERLRVSASLRSQPSRKKAVSLEFASHGAPVIAIFHVNFAVMCFGYFCGTAEINKQIMFGVLHQTANEEGLRRVILILQSKMNFHAKKMVDQYPIKVETFHIADLLVNVTKHVLEPKHEVLTAEEKQKLLEEHKVDNYQVIVATMISVIKLTKEVAFYLFVAAPKMLETDAIAKYCGIEKGQVVKSTYSGSLTGSLVNYRCVVTMFVGDGDLVGYLLKMQL
ncbi:hypothetical protein RJ639_044374 [Escallonia herrerae]|uniref:Uncharacterized protein n=1 Tax=Escallonia herrerae TaxID=1293975 RepID=A0AA88WDD7_9ASTE|nr:hypothetical protein RJ639_044374 [Escallonia herrerae]